MENDLFNLTPESVKTETAKSSGGAKDIWKPSADKGTEGVYTAIIRFVPWHKNTKKSIMEKWTCWLENPLTDSGKYVDCPSTINKKSILQDMFFKLRNSESVAEQKLQTHFSRRPSHASLIQIIKDTHNPDLNGKLMIWNYGMTVRERIEEIMQPEFGEPHVPFDLFEGRAFLVKVRKKAGYNNYDSCKFIDEVVPFIIDGKKMTPTPENIEKIKNYLVEHSPDLSKFDYKEWDEETYQYVNEVIRNVVPNGELVEQVLKDSKKFKSKSMPIVDDDPLSDMTTNAQSDDEPNNDDPLDINLDIEDDSEINLKDLDDDDFDESLYENL